VERKSTIPLPAVVALQVHPVVPVVAVPLAHQVVLGVVDLPVRQAALAVAVLHLRHHHLLPAVVDPPVHQVVLAVAVLPPRHHPLLPVVADPPVHQVVPAVAVLHHLLLAVVIYPNVLPVNIMTQPWRHAKSAIWDIIPKKGRLFVLLVPSEVMPINLALQPVRFARSVGRHQTKRQQLVMFVLMVIRIWMVIVLPNVLRDFT